MTEEIFQDKEEPVAGPGKLLQSAREEKNLRPEDVAYEIRLTPAQVLALEENDYSKMPEETYVRGYLRNYARLVGIPENDILMAFARHIRSSSSSEVKPQPVAPVGEGDINKGSNGFRILAAAIFLSVILISAVWVFEPYNKDAPDTAEVTSEVTEIEESKATVPVGPSTLKLEQADEKTSISEAIATPAIEPEAVEGDGSDRAAETASMQDTDSALETQQGTEQVAEPDPGLTPATATDSTDADTEDAADAGALLISYSKDSWTDIRDADGKKLVYRTVKAGENIALSGPLPLSLFFGFAQGVKVTFNGEEIDVDSHTRGVFARFTVGETVSQ